MATNPLHLNARGASRILVLTIALAGCVTATGAAILTPAAAAETAPAADSSPSRCFAHSLPLTVRSAAVSRRPSSSSGLYGWPLKPFDRQHPVRAYFNDPRHGKEGNRSFHFGIDISAPDGTPVYAVAGGTVHLSSARAVAVDHGARVTAYWHIVPVVRHRQRVRKHQLLGHIEAPWAHVHFAEMVDRRYVNPLRAGALEPYADTTTPTIAGLQVTRAGQPAAVRGRVDLVVDAFDTVRLRVAAPWNDLPVTPVLLRWRLLRGARPVVGWRTGVDFRLSLLPKERFWSVYAPPTHKNGPNRPGRYCFYLARRWDTRALRPGTYRLDVAAIDTDGNQTLASTPLRIASR